MTSIKDVIGNIEKRFGKEAIATNKVRKDVEFLPTGSLGLDIALGGGWAKGRIVELYGWESSGKSTLALHAAASAQKEGKIVVYIDCEHAIDLNYANALGVNTDLDSGLWYLSQPDSGEDAIEIGREFAKCEDVGLIVFDSKADMIPRGVLAGEAGDQKMGLSARMFSQYGRTLVAPASKSGAVVMFIDQLREKIGVSFGNPETTTGGHAIKFLASQRVKVWKSGNTKDGEEVVANGTKCKVEKNKVAIPLKQCAFDIVFGKGIDQFKEIIDIAVAQNIIKRSGAWYSYGEVKLGQGIDNTKMILNDNPELFQEITKKVTEILKIL